MPIQKGRSRGAPKGNRNGAPGPKIGRRNRPSDKPRGKPFAKGENSHDGTVFQRGPDDLPRRNLALFGACVYHDGREMFHRQLLKGSAKDHNYALRVLDWIAHVNGYPKKNDAVAGYRPGATFVFADGTPALPEPVGGGATPAASAKAQADEALILAGMHVVPN